MKKILLLLIFLCSLGFAEVGGFGDLKWGESQKDSKQILMKSYNLDDTAVFSFDDRLKIIFENIEFSGVDLKDVYFYFNKNDKFYKWMAESYTIKKDKKYIMESFKKQYNLTEGKDDDALFYLYGNFDKEFIDIYFYPDKIEFVVTSTDYLK